LKVVTHLGVKAGLFEELAELSVLHEEHVVYTGKDNRPKSLGPESSQQKHTA